MKKMKVFSNKLGGRMVASFGERPRLAPVGVPYAAYWANTTGARWSNGGNAKWANTTGSRWSNGGNYKWANTTGARWSNGSNYKWANTTGSSWSNSTSSGK